MPQKEKTKTKTWDLRLLPHIHYKGLCPPTKIHYKTILLVCRYIYVQLLRNGKAFCRRGKDKREKK